MTIICMVSLAKKPFGLPMGETLISTGKAGWRAHGLRFGQHDHHTHGDIRKIFRPADGRNFDIDRHAKLG